MKDSEFIELLNLYLDHEISAGDAARLEAEVQTNLTRRRIYQQYCRMQKACKLVAADFQNDSEPAIASDQKVVAFSPVLASADLEGARGSRTAGFYTWGTFVAVAACVAIIFVGRNRQESLDNTPGVLAAPAIAQSSAPVEKAAPSAASDSPARALAQRPQATIFSNPLLLTGNAQAQALFTAAVNQADNQLAWLQTVKLAPVEQQPVRSDDNLHFAAKLQTEGRALGNRAGRQNEPADEAVGFQFVK